MTDVFRAGKGVSKSRSAIPVPVLIAGSAIIATRFLSLLLLANELGFEEITAFIHRSTQAWDSTLIFIASLLVFGIELGCATALMRGDNRGRWGYAITQAVVMLYMLVASFGWVYPEIFSVSGATNGEIVHTLIMQKVPDMLVLILLFIPATSRRFFSR